MCRDSFIGITCHLFDHKRKFRKTFHFCLRPFYEQHTVANILEKVTRIMDEFGKVNFVCTDNDHNIKKALFEQHRGADYWCWACSSGGGRKFPGTHIGTSFSQDVWIWRRGGGVLQRVGKFRKVKKFLFHKLLFCTGPEALRKVRSICCSQTGVSSHRLCCRQKSTDEVRNEPFFHRL